MVQVLGVAVLLLVSGCTRGRNLVGELSATNGGPWGDWYDIDMCPDGHYATGFSLKVDPPEGIADDTTLNGIRLVCSGNPFERTRTIQSGVGKWGDWTPVVSCPKGVLTRFTLKVDPYQGCFYDDTAANNIRFTCSDGTELEGSGGAWGSYGEWRGTCYYGICGLQTRLDPPRWFTDQTALNDVKMLCCKD
ncbi:vitelline membrane outer layer protein 1 homolog [Ambystoma mexicanum]|uniref:vitelline membrane outer layer protein 1 homolog n=1 Tax=Ambystoma mexicanum TaxID=8296 RepID=UPI0037E725CC